MIKNNMCARPKIFIVVRTNIFCCIFRKTMSDTQDMYKEVRKSFDCKRHNIDFCQAER